MGACFQDHIFSPVDDVSVSSVLFCKWLVCSAVCQWRDSSCVGDSYEVSSVDSMCIGFCEISGSITAAGLINLCFCSKRIIVSIISHCQVQ